MRARAVLLAWLACTGCSIFGGRGGDDPGIDVLFRGNKKLSVSRLEDALARFNQDFAHSSHEKSAVDDAAWDLERAYHAEGFPFVRVDYRYETPPNQRKRAVFTIVEGPRTELVRVIFDGNRSIRDKELEPFFARESIGLLEDSTRWYVESDVQNALEDVADLYRVRGYLDVVVEPPRIEYDKRRANATLRIAIDEGVRYSLRSIDVKGGDPRVDPASIDPVRKKYLNKPYYERLSVEILGALEEVYADQGFADARVERVGRDVTPDGTVALAFNIKPGPRVRIGATRVSGNHSTSDSFIKSRMSLRTGAWYDREDERKSFARMFKSGIFDYVSLRTEKEPDEDASAESVTRRLDVRVVEGRAIETFLEPGYGSYEGARLSAGARHKNLFGSGLILDLRGTISEKSLVGNLSLIDPWLLGTEATTSFTVFGKRRQEPSFERLEIGTGVAVHGRISSTIEGLVGYQYRRSDVTDVEVLDQLAQEATKKVNISEVLASLAYDSRDNVFQPTRGTFAKVSAELGLAAIGSELDFVRWKAQDALFLPLGPTTILGFGVRAGIIQTLVSSQVIPLQERFYTGGENSVRSFRESQLGPKDSSGKPLGGEGYTVFSTEIRQRLRGPFEGALFFDIGNVVDRHEDLLKFEGYRSAIGLGLRYALPVGPIRLDAAVNPNPHDDESSFVVHFSLGMAF